MNYVCVYLCASVETHPIYTVPKEEKGTCPDFEQNAIIFDIIFDYKVVFTILYFFLPNHWNHR